MSKISWGQAFKSSLKIVLYSIAFALIGIILYFIGFAMVISSISYYGINLGAAIGGNRAAIADATCSMSHHHSIFCWRGFVEG